MGHDEVKSFRNALIVMSGLAVLAPVVLVGWAARSAISSVEEKATSAIAQVSASVNGVQLQVVKHVSEDDERVANLGRRIDQCCPVGAWDALPPDRRRPRPVTGGGG